MIIPASSGVAYLLYLAQKNTPTPIGEAGPETSFGDVFMWIVFLVVVAVVLVLFLIIRRVPNWEGWLCFKRQ